MMRYGLTAFASRRILLHPLRWLLLGLALATVTFLGATTVMALFAVEATATRVILAGPALVVSRVDAGGWAPIDPSFAHSIKQIPGVESATPRVWGILPGPPSVTIIADPSLPIGSRQALVGNGIPATPGDILELRGLDGATIEFGVKETLDRRTNIVAHDVVLVPSDAARFLLLLPREKATDIAVDSARDEENNALVIEIAEAIPGPVRVVTRAQMLGAYRVQAGHRGTIAFALLLPSILALAWIVIITASGSGRAREDVGKLKLMGWTTTDVARLHVLEVFLVAVIAVAVGLVIAYAGLFLFGGWTFTMTWMGWKTEPPNLTFSSEGAMLSLIVIGASVLLPCLVAALVPAIRLARTDPMDLVEAP